MWLNHNEQYTTSTTGTNFYGRLIAYFILFDHYIARDSMVVSGWSKLPDLSSYSFIKFNSFNFENMSIYFCYFRITIGIGD